MKQNITTFKTSLLLAGSLALAASCQDYEPFSEQQVQDVAYTREFTRQFGDIDPNQNWDLFGQLARGTRGAGTRAAAPDDVTVVDATTNVVVTQEDNEEYQKVLPESEQDPTPYADTNLGRVTQDFTSTARTFTITPVHYHTSGADVIGIYWYASSPDEPGATTIIGADGNPYYVIRKQIYENKTHLVGIGSKSYWKEVSVGTDEQWNKLIENFPTRYVIADGTDAYRDENWNVFADGKKIYDTGIKNQWGDFNNYKEFPTSPTGENQSQYLPDVLKNDLCTLFGYKVTDGTSTYSNGGGNWYANALVEQTTEEVVITTPSDTEDAASYFKDGATYLRSTPITVTVPADVPYYGFYLTNGNAGSVYSESKLNTPVLFDGETESRNACYVATFDMKDINPDAESQRFLCFEDWYGSNNQNFDLNDIVFTVTGINSEHITDNESTNEWALLVCEDLAKYDFDFNDVSLLLNYTDGLKREYDVNEQGEITNITITEDARTLTVTAVSAGGAYDSEVWINGTDWGEIHSLLPGITADDSRKPRILNAGKTYNGDGSKMTITTGLPEKNVGTGDDQYPTFLSQLFNTEGFFRIVCDGNQDAQRIIESGVIKTDVETSTAPQMMLLPDYFEWPQEEVHISEAYEDFSSWVSDVNAVDWIFTSQIERNITDRGDLYVETNLTRIVGTVDLTGIQTGVTFTYTDKNGRVTTYQSCSMVPFTDSYLTSMSQNQYYARLTVTYSMKPATTTYLDYANGDQLMEDSSGQNTVTVYHLSKSQLQKAIDTGAIYFMGQNNQTVVITSAKLDLYH